MTVFEFVCPTCGMRAWSTDYYVTCASCGTLYYAAQSAHRPLYGPSQATVPAPVRIVK